MNLELHETLDQRHIIFSGISTSSFQSNRFFITQYFEWDPIDLISIYIDGASRGNPGLSGIGVVIVKDHSKIKEITEFVGTKTNNRAEYLALKKALEVAIEIDDEVTVFSDSKLVVQQRNRQYKIRNKELKILAREISNLERKYKVIIYKHIPRQENRLADLLANRAIEDELNISNSSLRSDGSDEDSELT